MHFNGDLLFGDPIGNGQSFDPDAFQLNEVRFCHRRIFFLRGRSKFHRPHQSQQTWPNFGANLDAKVLKAGNRHL